ncbi:hypothetical protein EYF80_014258 [Liparis tanakae]|uniref:Uncharacterized protein n=1 Tax=Liparis tanakae TaxID=230148 RepID=A0A4Z2IBS6_9TELE|nr:hypothetical protein EYF80_014258 [Liparis tanakae]
MVKPPGYNRKRKGRSSKIQTNKEPVKAARQTVSSQPDNSVIELRIQLQPKTMDVSLEAQTKPLATLSAFSYIPPRRTDPKESSYFNRESTTLMAARSSPPLSGSRSAESLRPGARGQAHRVTSRI